MNIGAQLGRSASIVYVTADTRGWYGDPTPPELEAVYATLLERPFAPHYAPSKTMLDLVVRANDAVLDAVGLACPETHKTELASITERLLEYSHGSIAFFTGLFLGSSTLERPRAEGDARTDAQRLWHDVREQKDLALKMAQGPDAKPLPKEKVVAACKPFFDFLAPLLATIVQERTFLESAPQLDETQQWRVMALLVGASVADAEGNMPASFAEMKLQIAVRVQDVLLCLLAVDEVPHHPVS